MAFCAKIIRMNSIMRAQRKARKLTLKAAAAQVDTDVSHLSKLERGERVASTPLARRIAALYGITVDDVVGGPDKEGLVSGADSV